MLSGIGLAIVGACGLVATVRFRLDRLVQQNPKKIALASLVGYCVLQICLRIYDQYSRASSDSVVWRDWHELCKSEDQRKKWAGSTLTSHQCGEGANKHELSVDDIWLSYLRQEGIRILLGFNLDDLSNIKLDLKTVALASSLVAYWPVILPLLVLGAAQVRSFVVAGSNKDARHVIERDASGNRSLCIIDPISKEKVCFAMAGLHKNVSQLPDL